MSSEGARANAGAAESAPLRPGDDGTLIVDPSAAGWRWLSFALHRLASNALAPLSIGGRHHETAVVVLTGGALMTFDSRPPERLPGRASVFDGLPWAAYLPPGRTAALEPMGEEAEVAVVEAPGSGQLDPGSEVRIIGPDAVETKLRGAAAGSCQVNAVLGPDDPADRLLLFEILVPAGNWSSWPPPPGDGDDHRPEAQEEVDHFRFRHPDGWGVGRIYDGAGSPDRVVMVASGDTVIVPGGWHTFAAAPDVDAYYLRALAVEDRALAGRAAWGPDAVRDASIGMAVDPRLPLVER